MFGRSNNIQNQKKQPVSKDENVRKEAELEEDQKFVQPMGNEAANTELMNEILNEADNRLNISDENIENFRERPDTGKKRRQKPENFLINNLRFGRDSDNSNNINNINNDNFIRSNEIRNDDSSSGDEEDLLNINTDPPKEKKKGKKKPDKEDAKAVLELAEEIAGDDPEGQPDKFPALSTYAEDEDLMSVTGAKKNVRKKGTRSTADKIKPSKAGVDNVKGIEDARWKAEAAERIKQYVNHELPTEEDQEAFRAEELEKLKNWNFTAQKLDKVKKPGKFRKLLSLTAVGMGKLLRAALQVLSLGHFWRVKSMTRFNFTDTNKWQTKKDYRTIPGWEGAKFDSDAASGDEVAADFRRIPTVWSRLTAAKAGEEVEKKGRKEEKPLDPVVSVMIDQPDPNTGQDMVGREFGHAMLGIEYSRRSTISNRYERYKLQYGFYPVGKVVEAKSGTMTMLKHGAVVPGYLSDDFNHKYDVSRSYRAKPEQVNAIFKASEKFAEGGYSYYDRNCVSFVKEMVVNTAHLATGGTIFEKAEVNPSHWGNIGAFGAEAFNQNAQAGLENTLMDLAQAEDQSYQNFGGKRATKQDWVQYRASMKKGSGDKDTFTPGATGDRLRRMEGDDAGEIGSYEFAGALRKKSTGEIVQTLTRISAAVEKAGSKTSKLIWNEILTEKQREQAPVELVSIYDVIPWMGNSLITLSEKIDENIAKKNAGIKNEQNKIKRENIKESHFVSPEDLRDTRKELSRNIGLLNVLLKNYLKNDKRAHQPVLNMISLLNYGIEYVDDMYRNSVRGGMTEDMKANDIRDEMVHTKITVQAGGKKEIFSPTHYESYIQIYKDPKTAIEKYARYKELKKKETDKSPMTKAEKKELSTLARLETLALQFDNAHNYMLEKDAYNQQDIDYAFRLHDRETKGLQTAAEFRGGKDVNEAVRDNYKSASGIYITLFMNKFFRDIREQWMKDPEEGGIADEDGMKFSVVNTWLDKYLSDRVKRKKNGFEMIVRGLYRSMKAAAPNREVDEQALLDKLADVILQICINRNFEDDMEPKASKGYVSLSSAILTIAQNNSCEFTKLVSKMFQNCDLEDSGMELQGW